MKIKKSTKALAAAASLAMMATVGLSACGGSKSNNSGSTAASAEAGLSTRGTGVATGGWAGPASCGFKAW